MIEARKQKVGLLCQPMLLNTTEADDQTYIDTAGFKHLTVLLVIGATTEVIGSTATTTAPYLEECDTSGGSYTTFSAALSTVIATDDDEKIFRWDVNLRGGRMRYIKVNDLVSDSTNTSNICCIGILSDPETSPLTTTTAGVEEWIEV